MDGILLVDKPSGLTSHDVVAKVRGLLHKAANQQSIVNSQKLSTDDSRLSTPSAKLKVGHTGTLDPAATGLLILVLGTYTKQAERFSKLDKVYEVELTLGFTSPTGDSEGQLTKISTHKPSKDQVKQALNSFVGRIKQTPPAYSAIKVDGQRAYKLARAGKPVEIKSRSVMIYSIHDIKYDYPKLVFSAKVSSGTYIRSLAEDIGNRLKTGAYVSKLRRTEVGNYKIEQAKTLDKITTSDIMLWSE